MVKKVEEIFGGMKNNLYLCIVKSNQGVAHNLRGCNVYYWDRTLIRNMERKGVRTLFVSPMREARNLE